jgi:hypothetical protein
MLVLAALLLLQDEPVRTVAPGGERWSAVRIDVSGKVVLRYSAPGAEVNQLAGAGAGSGDFWSGRFGVRLDATVQDGVVGTIELETRSYDDGLNLPLSSDPGEEELVIKQGYIDVPGFLSDKLRLRVGVQRYSVRTRPHDAAFFLDLGEAEGFFSGVSPATGDGAWVADRDVLEATGVRLQWTPYEILTVDAFAHVYAEGGPGSSDEAVYGLSASARVADAMAAWILAVLVSGGPGFEQVWTAGAGWNGYLGEGKPVELWLEVYAQGGETTGAADHAAWAFNAGARWVGEGAWVEVGLEFRSGDEQGADGDNEAFLSYENQNRFLILESAEFGLDVDTNLVLVRGAAGLGPFQVASRPLRIRLDVGHATAAEPFGVAAVDGWGLETDLTVAWDYNESLVFSFQGAWLAGSDVVEALSLDGEDDAWSLLAGANLKF